MAAENTPVVRAWVAEPLSAEVRRAVDRLARAEDVRAVAVMPDVHLATTVCVGCVVATGTLLYPEAVGGDIGCGVSTVRVRGPADSARASSETLLDDFSRLVPVLKRPARAALSPPGDVPEGALARAWRRDGRLQFGTLGRGNHFLELQEDEAGALWITVHSGSRALGPIARDAALAAGRRTRSGLIALEADGAAGRAYLADVATCTAYASASRGALLAAAAAVVHHRLGFALDEASLMDCDHNHVRRERIDGRALWVHRKGALAARAGEPAVIPGSMGSPTFHVVGRGEAAALMSSSHGAGRCMSRGEARLRISPRALRRRMGAVVYDRAAAAALVGEAPQAYKDIVRVMRAQKDLTRVVRRLTPVLVYKGGG